MSIWLLRVLMLSACSLFFGLAVTVFIIGIPEWERGIYGWVHRAMPPDAVPVWFVLTKLGSERFVLPAGLVILALLPGRLLRHAWLWVAVVLASTWLEGVAKDLVGRARPVSFRPGFPSGHTTTAAAFYFMLAYLAATVVHRQWHPLAWMLATVAVITVAVSRIALQAHWPLDTVGGAALGITLAAAAAWWHQSHLWEPRGASRGWRIGVEWLDRRKDVVALASFAVLLVMPRFADDHRVRDLLVDASGLLVLAAGVTVRLWAVAQPGLVARGDERRTALVTTGPYAYVRHPMYIGNVLVGIGVTLVAENILALGVVTSMMCLLYRLVVRIEEAKLRARWGHAYDVYSATVPRFLPRRARGVRTIADVSVWAAVRQDYRALTTTALLATGAEITHVLSHLPR